MKIKNIKYFILSSFLSLAILSCEDSLDKADYENNDPIGSTTLATYDAVEVGANYVVIEGVNNGGDANEMALVLSDNNGLYGAKRYSLEPEEDFSFRISGLVPNTTYYYASLEADSLQITANGEIKSFTTEDGVIAFLVDYATMSEAAWKEAFSSIDKDGDGEDWFLTGYPVADGLTKAYRSESWAGNALTPENYLLFPEIDFDGVQGSLAFQIVAATSYYAEAVRVVASSEPITEENCRDAEVLFTHTLESTAVYYGNVDIPSSFEGKPIYLALVHTDVSDMEAIYFLGATFIYK